MEIVGLVDSRDGGVTFVEPRTRLVLRRVYPVGGSRRAKGVDVLSDDRAMITTDDGRRELWSLADYSYIRDID